MFKYQRVIGFGVGWYMGCLKRNQYESVKVDVDWSTGSHSYGSDNCCGYTSHLTYGVSPVLNGMLTVKSEIHIQAQARGLVAGCGITIQEKRKYDKKRGNINYRSGHQVPHLWQWFSSFKLSDSCLSNVNPGFNGHWLNKIQDSHLQKVINCWFNSAQSQVNKPKASLIRGWDEHPAGQPTQLKQVEVHNWKSLPEPPKEVYFGGIPLIRILFLLDKQVELPWADPSKAGDGKSRPTWLFWQATICFES